MVEQTHTPGTEPPADTTKPTGGNNPPRVAKPRKPRAPRAPKPTYTGTYAGGTLVTHASSRMILSLAGAPFGTRLRISWQLLRNKSVRMDGDHSIITPPRSQATSQPLAQLFNGAPDSDPQVRFVLD